MKNFLVSEADERSPEFLPDNANSLGDGNGCGAGNTKAQAGDGIGCGRHSDLSRDGGGIGAGSPLATNEGNGRGNGFETHHAIGLLHSGGLTDIREFTTFILLQPLIRRA